MRTGSRARGVLWTASAGVAAAALVLTGFATLADQAQAAAATGDSGALFNVTKTVIGTAPGGAVFQVDWSCNNASGGTLSFTATGGTLSLDSGGPTATSCAINESTTGGAENVAYRCEALNAGVTCAADGKSATFTGAPNPAGTFTVTNTYSNVLAPPAANPNPTTPGHLVTISGTGCDKAIFGGSQSTGGTVQVTIGFTPPVTLGPLQAQGGTGSWTVTLAVPPGTAPGSYSINAVCSDPVPYPATTLTIASAGPPPIVASPAFTG